MEVSPQDVAIAKGKRTKRQRLQSPIPFAVPANSITGEFGDEVGFVAENSYVQNTNLSPATSSELQYTTEEEEDMANCLILLAQGRSPSPKLAGNVVFAGVFQPNNRRFPDAAGVYECKTCYRTFPSFQALGGHRASHKKPKAMAIEEKKQLLSSDDEETHQFKNTVSLQLNQRGNLYSGKAKVHECAICGAEFTSGQALGGHMRRHRAVTPGANTVLSLTPMAVEVENQRPVKRQRSVISLDLDLNLPAPQEHDHHQKESKFLIKQSPPQSKPQPPLVFSTRALVDCHY